MVSGISYNNGRCFIYSRKCQNSKKQRDFGGIGIYAMSDNHTAPENSFQPWRICSVETLLAYAFILIFS